MWYVQHRYQLRGVITRHLWKDPPSAGLSCSASQCRVAGPGNRDRNDADARWPRTARHPVCSTSPEGWPPGPLIGARSVGGYWLSVVRATEPRNQHPAQAGRNSARVQMNQVPASDHSSFTEAELPTSHSDAAHATGNGGARQTTDHNFPVRPQAAYPARAKAQIAYVTNTPGFQSRASAAISPAS